MRTVNRFIAAIFAASLILPAAVVAPVLAAGPDDLVFVGLPATVTAGASTVVTVEADNTGVVDPAYVGNVTLTTGNVTDVVTPLTHQYVAGDNGTFDFHVTFNQSGPRTLGATDDVSSTAASGGLTVNVGAADHLTWVAEPDNGFGGVVFAIQPQIEVRDAGNNLVASPDFQVSVDIDAPNSPPGGTMSGLKTVTSSGGTATFTGLSVDKAQDGYRFVATAPGLLDDRSDPENIAPGPAHHLTYAQGPTATIQGVAISPSITVQVRDAVQNVVTSDTSVVHLAIGTNPSAGTLSGTATHNAVAGVATFTGLSINLAGVGYTLVATDGGLTQATSAPFTITLQPNHAPAGADKTITTNEDTAHTFTTADFGFSDVSDVPADTLLAVKITSLPAVGSLRDNGVAVSAGSSIPVADITGNKLTFAPAANANGAGYADFTFQVQDNGGTANGGVDLDQTANTITVNVTAVNDAPVAVADTTVVKQGTVLTTTALTGVLANDTDVDTSHGTLTAVLNAGPAHGTLTLHADGSYVYTPIPSYLGGDSFTYHAFDGTLPSNIVTVAITVYINHAPIAQSDRFKMVSGSPATTFDVLANDNAANPDVGETLHITAVGAAAHGTVTLTAGGASIKYHPKSTFVGADTFTYTISDGQFTAKTSVLVTVRKDTVKPTTTGPVQTIAGQSLGARTVVVRLAWTGADVGSGVARYQLQQSTNGHTYTNVTLSKATSRSASRTLTVGSTYRFRVRAIDKRGNVGAWTYGPKFKVFRYQETSVTYTGAWASRSAASYSGGKERSTSATGASATFSTTGRTFSWVAIRAASRGTAQVFVDGVLATTVSLTLASTKYHYVVYSRTFTTSGSHTIRIVVTSAPPKLVDVDAFIVLR